MFKTGDFNVICVIYSKQVPFGIAIIPKMTVLKTDSRKNIVLF